MAELDRQRHPLESLPRAPDREEGRAAHNRDCGGLASISEAQYRLTYHLVQTEVLCRFGSTKPHEGQALWSGQWPCARLC
jgi:hypothetical protein